MPRVRWQLTVWTADDLRKGRAAAHMPADPIADGLGLVQVAEDGIVTERWSLPGHLVDHIARGMTLGKRTISRLQGQLDDLRAELTERDAERRQLGLQVDRLSDDLLDAADAFRDVSCVDDEHEHLAAELRAARELLVERDAELAEVTQQLQLAEQQIAFNEAADHG